MRSTLFYIPREFLGLPVFGFGWLLGIWVIGAGILLVQSVRREGWTRDLLGQLALAIFVGLFIVFVLPSLAEEKGLPIRGYGTMLLVAMISAIGLALWRGKPRGFDEDFVISLALWVFVAGIAGARLFYVVEYWQRVRVVDGVNRLLWGPTLISIINLAQGGLVVYGSVFGGILAILIYTWRRRAPVLATLDLVAPSFMLGLALGRIGCFLNGCCFGAVCELPWAVRFPPGSLAHIHQLEKGQAFLLGLKFDRQDPPRITDVEKGSQPESHGIKSGDRLLAVGDIATPTVAQAQAALIEAAARSSRVCLTIEGRADSVCLEVQRVGSLPVHPTQIYSSINAFLICLFLLAFERIKRHDGQVVAMMFTLYSVTRFLLEILRDDEPWIFAGRGFGLTIAQVFCVAIFMLTVAFWLYIWQAKPGLQPGPGLREVNV
jgi:phosphatidylglycerol:prolipoprotein diacylglycerol transferase